MSLVQWSDRLSVGIDDFDREHQQLIAMLNDLFDAVQAGRGRDALGEILNRLIAYTETHFAHEEDLMRRSGYPGFAAHKREHDTLTRQVRDLQQKYHSGATTMLSTQVLTFLKDWLMTHIQGTDTLYTAHLTAHWPR